MTNQFELREKPVFLPVDQKPRRVTVVGDTVSYADTPDASHSEARGQIKGGGHLTFAVGQWLRTEGQSFVSVDDVDGRPQVKDEEQEKAEKRSKAAKKAARTRAKKAAKK